MIQLGKRDVGDLGSASSSSGALIISGAVLVMSDGVAWIPVGQQ